MKFSSSIDQPSTPTASNLQQQLSPSSCANEMFLAKPIGLAQPGNIRDRVLSNSSIASTSTSYSQNYQNPQDAFTGLPVSLLQNQLQNTLLYQLLFSQIMVPKPQMHGTFCYPTASLTTPDQMVNMTGIPFFGLSNQQQQQLEAVEMQQQLHQQQLQQHQGVTSPSSASVFIPKPIRSNQTPAAVTSAKNNNHLESSSSFSQALDSPALQMPSNANVSGSGSALEGSSSIQYQPNIIFDRVLSSEEMRRRRILRREKIDQYLLKKQSRRWDVLRYEVRKKIAKTRLRVKGRFVKEEDPSSEPKIIGKSSISSK